jgi:HAD superfamily hydrolase (TIGR01509 family)
MIKAILYDLDGVLVDACEWHYLALNMALEKVANDRIGIEEHYTTFNGLPTKKKIEMLIEQGRLRPEDSDRVWALKQELTKEAIESNASVDSNKIALHQYTHCKGIVSVCVTNSITETATLMLEKTGQLPYMQFVMTNEMVRNPKPHAEGYIRAMVKAGVMPDECIIVEDSEKGLAAARATGAHVCHVSGPSEVVAKVMKMIGELNEVRSA